MTNGTFKPRTTPLRLRGAPPAPARDPEIDALVDAMRARRDLSIRAIAQRAGVTPTTVSRLDRGLTRSPMHRTMSRIWNGLGYELRPVPIERGIVVPLRPGGGED